MTTSDHKETPASGFSVHADDAVPVKRKTLTEYLSEGYIPLDAVTCACGHFGSVHGGDGKCVVAMLGPDERTATCACQRFTPVPTPDQRIIPSLEPTDQREPTASAIEYAAVLVLVGGVADALCHYLNVLPWGPWK